MLIIPLSQGICLWNVDSVFPETTVISHILLIIAPFALPGLLVTTLYILILAKLFSRNQRWWVVGHVILCKVIITIV